MKPTTPRRPRGRSRGATALLALGGLGGLLVLCGGLSQALQRPDSMAEPSPPPSAAASGGAAVSSGSPPAPEVLVVPPSRAAVVLSVLGLAFVACGCWGMALAFRRRAWLATAALLSLLFGLAVLDQLLPLAAVPMGFWYLRAALGMAIAVTVGVLVIIRRRDTWPPLAWMTGLLFATSAVAAGLSMLGVGGLDRLSPWLVVGACLTLAGVFGLACARGASDRAGR